MRVLYIEDPVRAEGIMAATRKLFSESGYLYQENYVSILPGELEGAYAWLTVLLLLKSSQNATCAIADMGGHFSPSTCFDQSLRQLDSARPRASQSAPGFLCPHVNWLHLLRSVLPFVSVLRPKRRDRSPSSHFTTEECIE